MKSQRRTILITIWILVVLAALAAAWWWWHHNSMESAYERALEVGTPQALEQYIAQYPESPLKEQATLEMVLRKDKVSDYLVFLHHYPKSKDAPLVYGKIDSMGMVFVEGGRFVMGCDTCDARDEDPAHEVVLRDFYIDKHEVTVAEFRRFVEETDYITDAEREGSSNILVDEEWAKAKGVNWRHDLHGDLRVADHDVHPVTHVSWFDAKRYAEWAGKRLPTEAEWEYAAQGGQLSRGYVYSGSNDPNEVAWYIDNANNSTHPVGTKHPNELGIYDMSGNVYEWCSDWFEPDYYSISPRNNPTGPQSGYLVVLRGGGWNYEPDGLRCTNRINAYRLHWYGGIGFRCVADMPQNMATGIVPQ